MRSTKSNKYAAWFNVFFGQEHALHIKPTWFYVTFNDITHGTHLGIFIAHQQSTITFNHSPNEGLECNMKTQRRQSFLYQIFFKFANFHEFQLHYQIKTGTHKNIFDIENKRQFC